MLIEIFAAIRWFFTITTLLGLVSEIFLRRGIKQMSIKVHEHRSKKIICYDILLKMQKSEL